MKNPNGFGSVYKLSGNRKRKWVARKTISWEDGKQKRKIVGYYETKSEALKALANFEYNENSNITFKQVYEQWSEKHFKKISHGRVINIKSRYNVHLSKLDNANICDLKIKDLQELYDSLPLASGTANQVKSILKMIFDFAVRNEYIDKNPTEFVELKKHESVLVRKIFTNDEISFLWDNIDLELVDTILIMIYTGMRIEEFLNLKIKDINLEERYCIAGSKTEAGKNRLIPFNYRILPLITKRFNGKNKYLVTYNDKKMTYPTYRRAFVELMKKLNLKHTIHDCRHTFATLMSNAEANPVSIAKIIGHKDYNGVTAKIYTHKDKVELIKAVDMIN